MSVEVRCFGERVVAESTDRIAVRGYTLWDRVGSGADKLLYALVLETSEHGGYPLLEHLRKILDGPLVWAPGVEGAVVVSLRGGDFLFECGEDIAIGYERHDAEAVHLYLVETFSFRVATPEAAVALPAQGA